MNKSTWNAAIQRRKKTQHGAVTITSVLAGANMKIADVTATADADVTTGNIAHGLGAAPLLAWGQQLTSQALTALSAWALTTVDATNIVGTKLASVASLAVGVQYRICAWRPHSFIT